MRATPRRVLTLIASGLLLFAVAIGASLVVGVESIDVTRALVDPGSNDGLIFWQARMPRVWLAGGVGAALAMAGLAFQTLLRNPLADPYVLGISGGASVAGTLAIVLGLGASALGGFALPLFAFVGAMGATGAVLGFGRVRGRLVPEVALLAGVMMNALSSALVVAIRLVATPAQAHEALYWLTGTFASRVDTPRLVGLYGYVLLGGLVLMASAAKMNALLQGGDVAHTLGIDVPRLRRRIFLCGSLLTGAAVACAGPIGFVGILVPHVMRSLLGPDHRLLVPASAIGGALFALGADTFARLAFLVVGTEPTAGVITALVGAPFFLFALRQRERSW